MVLYAFTWTEFAQQLAAGIREGASDELRKNESVRRSYLGY